MKNKDKLIGILMLVLCTVIWGMAFSFQSIAGENIPPVLLIGFRFLIAGIVLSPFMIISLKVKKHKFSWKNDFLPGLITGIFLAIASISQQYGINMTTAGKAGFLTAMYIVFVPLVMLIGFHKKITFKQVLAIVITVIGVGVMSINEGFSINKGDLLCLLSGFLFAFQILAVDYYSKKVDGITLAQTSFISCGVLSCLVGATFERVTIENIRVALWPILYLGIMSSGLAYTLQILGQKRVQGLAASLTMSLESVFSAIFGWIILHEAMSAKEIIGAILLMIGVVLVQVFEVLDNKKIANKEIEEVKENE